MKNSTLLMSGCLLVSVFAHRVAWPADAGTPAETDANSGALQEIVVTAEKRESTAQKTPISMEVYSAAEVAEKGIVNLESLASTDTSLNFNAGGGEPYLTLRGVSSSNTTEVGSPSVPVSIDGFVSNRSWSLTSSLFDLERIEVLRGPQGTLYGRSSTGGLVNVISNKPTNEFEASGSVEYGNYNTLNGTGVLNVPVSDSLQVRVAFSSRSHDGYRGVVDVNGEAPGKSDDENSHAVRLQVAFEPIENFKGLLTFEDVHINDLDTAVAQIPFINSPTVPGDILHSLPNLGDTTNFPLYGHPWEVLDSKIGKWNFAYDGLPGDLKVTYLGGYGLEEWHHNSPSGNLFSFAYGGPEAFFPLRSYQQNEEPHTENHELRLSSNSTGPFVWQTGLYYFKEDNNLFSQELLNPGAGGNPAVNGTTAASQLYEFIFPSVLQTSKAVFAQGSYDVTDTSKITAGARYNKDEIVRTGIFNLFLFDSLGTNEYGQASSSKTTWHVGYDWTPTSTNLVYAKADAGYKPGGFGSTGCPNYAPETVTTYELGSKNRFLSDTLQFNVAGYLDNYKDQQVTEFTSQCLGGTSTSNAGRSKIYGLEAELTALVDPIGKFDASLSYLHARFLSFDVAPTVYPGALADCKQVIVTAAGSNCNLAGNSLTQAPDLTVSVGYDYTWNVPSGGKVDFRLEGKYTSKQYFDPFNFADTEQAAYTVGNAYLNYTAAKYSFGLYARNFTNRLYFTSAAESSGFGEGEYAYSFGAPRTFGVRMSVMMK